MDLITFPVPSLPPFPLSPFPFSLFPFPFSLLPYRGVTIGPRGSVALNVPVNGTPIGPTGMYTTV